jgi:hypothetical protein
MACSLVIAPLMHQVLFASPFFFLIVSAVPVVAMPGVVQKRDALAAKAALMMVGGKLAVAVGKRCSDELAATSKPKRSRKSKKVKEGMLRKPFLAPPPLT